MSTTSVMPSEASTVSSAAGLRARHGLAELADPSRYHEPIDLAGADTRRLIEQLRDMVLIRVAEEKIGDMVTVEGAASAKDGSDYAGSMPTTQMRLASGQKLTMR